MTQPSPTDPTIGPKANLARHLSRYSWAKLIARVCETDPLSCGHCGERMWGCRLNRRKFTQREGRRKVIYGEVIYGITRRLANGKSMRRIQMRPIEISRCVGKR
jgi:hypothetical protein